MCVFFQRERRILKVESLLVVFSVYTLLDAYRQYSSHGMHGEKDVQARYVVRKHWLEVEE